MDNIERINEIRNKAVASVRNYAKPRIFAAFIQILISIMCIVGIQMLAMNFNFDALKQYTFWIKTGFTTVGIFLLYRAVINARFDKTASRQSVIDKKNKYNALNNQKGLDLKEYLIEYNQETKINTYIASYNRRIFKLENKIMRSRSEKRIEALSNKVEILKKFISQEYIMANIDKIKIKYYKVYFSDFSDEKVFKNFEIQTRETYSKEFNKASFNKMWTYVLSSALLMVSVFDFGTYGITSFVTSIAGTVFMVVTRIATALMDADNLYDNTITKSIIDRTTILEQYFEWKKTQKPEIDLEQERQAIKAEYEAKAKSAIEKALKENRSINRSNFLESEKTN